MPIYIHPHIPTPNVCEAYYSGLPEGADRVVLDTPAGAGIPRSRSRCCAW